MNSDVVTGENTFSINLLESIKMCVTKLEKVTPPKEKECCGIFIGLRTMTQTLWFNINRFWRTH